MMLPYSNAPYSGASNPQQTAKAQLQTALLFPNFRAGIAAVKSGTANTRVLFVGDSITLACDAAGASTAPGYDKLFATYLNSMGVTTNWNGWCGDSTGTSETGSRDSIDTRLSIGSWAGSPTTLTLGGAIFYANSAATFVYTPGVTWDTCNIFYPQYGGSGAVIHATATGGSTQTLNEALTGNLSTATCVAASASASNTLTAVWISGSTGYLLGMEAYNSATKSVNIMNAGWFGSRVTDWCSTASFFSSLNVITYLAPSLVVIMAGGNDWGMSTPIATFTADLQAIITAAQGAGSDVLLMIDNPNGSVALSSQQVYVSAIYQLAVKNNCGLIDTWARWVSEPFSSALGYYASGDVIHPSPKGYTDMAAALFNYLNPVIGII